MDAAKHAELEEKARLRQELERQQQDQNHHQPLVAPPGRSPASGSNTVPMTEEELHVSPAHGQRSPAYSPQPSLMHGQQSPLPSPLSQIPARVPVPVQVQVPVSVSAPVQTPPRSPTPPPYSGPSAPVPEPAATPESPGAGKPVPRYPGLPALDYRLYRPPLFELSADKTTIKTTAAHLSSSVEALVMLIRQQATVPPKPQVHIVGRRGGIGSGSGGGGAAGGGSSSSGAGGGRLDFSIKLNLLPLLVPEDPRQRMDYLRCVGPGELALRGGSKPSAVPEVAGDGGGLEAWAARYVADPASVKSFALERVVVNLDAEWLEGQIRGLAVAMRYPGTIAVSFPLAHARVVVQSPDRVNRFFTSVAGFFAGKKKYEVVKAVWPFATMPRGGEARRCAVQSEETWWKEWKEPIRYAIATKRHGWVTNEDKLEALMEGTPSSPPMDVDWGP